MDLWIAYIVAGIGASYAALLIHDLLSIRAEIESGTSTRGLCTGAGRSCREVLIRKRLGDSAVSGSSGDMLHKFREELFEINRTMLGCTSDQKIPRFLAAAGRATCSPVICYAGARRIHRGEPPNEALAKNVVLISSSYLSPAARARIEYDITHALPGLSPGKEHLERLVKPIGIGTFLIEERAVLLVGATDSRFEAEALWIGYQSNLSGGIPNSRFIATCAEVFSAELRLAGLLNESRCETLAAVSRIEQTKLAVARVAHDIRSPLSSIEGVLGLMVEADNRDESAEIARIGRESCRYARQLAEELVIAARDGHDLEVADARGCDIVNSIKDIVGAFRVSCSAEVLLETDLAEDHPRIQVCVSHATVRRVVENLLSNAVKYGAGTPIVVRISQRQPGVVLYVSDSGPGMSQGQLDKLCEPFVRERSLQDGFGLGLSSVKSLVTSFGGKFDVKSHLGQGTIVSVVFPGVASDRSVEQSEISKHVPQLLILDDSAELGESLGRVLMQKGIPSMSFVEPELFLEALSQNPGCKILTDYQLVGDSALTVIQKIRAVDSKSHIAVMSGQLPEQVAYALAAKGVEEIFSKPVDIRCLVSWIQCEVNPEGIKSGSESLVSA